MHVLKRSSKCVAAFASSISPVLAFNTKSRSLVLIDFSPSTSPPPQVRIDEVDEQWCGSLHIGLTTLAPPELPSCPMSGLSPSLPQLRTKVTWLLCGSEVRRNGVLQRQNYGRSLDRLTVRDVVP